MRGNRYHTRIFVALFVAYACSSCLEQEKLASSIYQYEEYQARIGSPDTKVFLDTDEHVCWNASDEISIFRNESQNECFVFQGTDGEREGTFTKKIEGQIFNSLDNVVSIYPYDVNNSLIGDELSFFFPHQQKYLEGTFARGSNIMFSKADGNMLSFHNLSGFLRLQLYGRDAVKSIRIYGNNGEKLSGNARFDINQVMPNIIISDEAFPEIILDCESGVQLKFEKSYATDFWIALPPIVFSKGITVEVTNTYGRVTTKYTRNNVTVNPSNVVTMAPFECDERAHTLAYWGDSIANDDVIEELQRLLGAQWKVIGCGVPGDTPHGISGRQGGVPFYIGSSIELPSSHTEMVEISSLRSAFDKDANNVGPLSGVTIGNSSYWYVEGNSSRLNNCFIGPEQIECKITMKSKKVYVNRVFDGPAITIPAGSQVWSNGAVKYRDADIVIVYMGTNKTYTTNDALASMYASMQEYATTERFLAVGYHMATVSSNTYWTENYRDVFQARFGDKYLDLKSVGNSQARTLLVDVGVYSDISEISEADISSIDIDKEWPASFHTEYRTNVHPNTYGSKALARLVYDKIKDLGYLTF